MFVSMIVLLSFIEYNICLLLIKFVDLMMVLGCVVIFVTRFLNVSFELSLYI